MGVGAAAGGSRAALRALHRARRGHRRQRRDILDRLYDVYAACAWLGLVVWILAMLFGGNPATPAQAERVASDGPALVGLAVAIAIAVGLRSAAAGGPLDLEAAVVQYEVLAPVPRRVVLRGPALACIRRMAGVGLCVGVAAGALAAQSLPGGIARLVACCGGAGLLAGATEASLAIAASGARISRLPAAVLGLALVAASLADWASGSALAPATSFGELALWPLRGGALPIVVPAALALLSVAAALWLVAGTSVDAARRRAAMMQQLRFSLALQDFRMVVLMARQWSADRLRSRPWLRLAIAEGASPARRVLRGLLRFPGVRIARMASLGALAGVALALSPRLPALLAAAALCLFAAAYDAVEAVAQEADHPTLWSMHPVQSGRLIVSLVAAGSLVMLPVTGLSVIAALVTLRVVQGSVPAGAAGVLVWSGLLGAFGAAIGASVSVLMGPADLLDVFTRSGGIPEFWGAIMMGRVLGPPALTAAALAPMIALRAGSQAGPGLLGGGAGLSLAALVSIAVGLAWLAAKRPRRS